MHPIPKTSLTEKNLLDLKCMYRILWHYKHMSEYSEGGRWETRSQPTNRDLGMQFVMEF